MSLSYRKRSSLQYPSQVDLALKEQFQKELLRTKSDSPTKITLILSQNYICYVFCGLLQLKIPPAPAQSSPPSRDQKFPSNYSYSFVGYCNSINDYNGILIIIVNSHLANMCYVISYMYFQSTPQNVYGLIKLVLRVEPLGVTNNGRRSILELEL